MDKTKEREWLIKSLMSRLFVLVRHKLLSYSELSLFLFIDLYILCVLACCMSVDAGPAGV